MGHQHLSQTKNTIASPPSQTNAIARSSTHPVEELQGAIGNRAVNQLLANQPTLQAKPTFGGLSRELVIQPKLAIGAVGDKYEQEADRISQQVVNQIHTSQSQSVQRQETSEPEDKLMMKSLVQRQYSSEASGNITPEIETSIQQEKGSGQPLAENIRQPMEQAFGSDFSGVKVHSDSESDRLNQSIQAKAFTTGQDIFFRQGTYDPGSRGGQELLAHELTHVVQQNGGVVQRQSKDQIGTSATESVQHEPIEVIAATPTLESNIVQCKYLSSGEYRNWIKDTTAVKWKRTVSRNRLQALDLQLFYFVSYPKMDEETTKIKRLEQIQENIENSYYLKNNKSTKVFQKRKTVLTALLSEVTNKIKEEKSRLLNTDKDSSSKEEDKQELKSLDLSMEVKEELKESTVENLSEKDDSKTEVEVKSPPLNRDKDSSSKEEEIEESDVINSSTQEVKSSTSSPIDFNQLASIEMPQQGRKGAVFILTDQNGKQLVVKLQEDSPHRAVIGTKILKAVEANTPNLWIPEPTELKKIKQELNKLKNDPKNQEIVSDYETLKGKFEHTILQELAPGMSIGKMIESVPMNLLKALQEKKFQDDLGRMIAADQFVGNSDRLQGETNMIDKNPRGFFNEGNLFIDKIENEFRAIGIDNDFQPTILEKQGSLQESLLGRYIPMMCRFPSVAVSTSSSFQQEVNLIVDRIIVEVKKNKLTEDLNHEIEQVEKSRTQIVQGVTKGANAALSILLEKRNQPKGEGWKREIIKEAKGTEEEHGDWKARKKKMRELREQK